ncbi:MAG: RecQ family ATP-dependent DNA helicase, partial [Oscillospiraceae bacterium]
MPHTKILKHYFGYNTFRTGQEQLINSILSDNDCLGIMPTGAGKSICFQVPAMMLDGVTLIISPLISLMKDQVNALTQAGISAAFINSSLTARQLSLALDKAKSGAYKLIYVAPERLMSYDFLELAQSVKIAMLTVDEAHCISQWGQDFRPSYARIPEFIAELPERPIVSAFTATATPVVRDDILSLLKLRQPTVLVTGFDRENLYFEVQKPKDKFGALTAFLQDKKYKSGIVYCSTRNAVEEVCSKLNKNKYSASRYHAGLSDRERHQNQDDFLYDRVQIMVATNAFGMGIDKSNVNFVVHYNIPKDVESYYQEAGRSGRDGEPADCILLYSGQDVRTNLWLIENEESKSAEIKER